MEEKSQEPGFWEDKETASKVSREISEISEEAAKFKELEKEINELNDFAKMQEKDVAIRNELAKKCQELEEKLAKEEFKTYFSGKYDRNNAILQISSGAGGQDAQDWAAMLLRMYERYCQKKGFLTKILHQSFGEGGGPEGRIGIKSVVLEIKGASAYGYLKKETGVHRLVRISPFSSQKLRHTSFALAEVLPELEKGTKEIQIKPEELKMETFKSSGPGGQNVNKRESAVRIIHLPSNIVVSSQSERSQGANRENAMKILYAKLYRLKEEEGKKEIKEIKGDRVSASWGNQIRSYVIHPYKLVKDLRTDVESSNVEEVLDGDLDKFVEAEIKFPNL